LPDVEILAEDRPRLIEFGKLGIAIERVLGKPDGAFLAEFNATRDQAIARAIEASPVALVLIAWFNDRGRGKQSMATGKLLHVLRLYNAKKGFSYDGWPKTAKGLGDILRRLAPALLSQDDIKCRNFSTGRVFEWELSDAG